MWDAVGGAEVVPRIGAAVRAHSEVLQGAGPAVSVRPEPARWSALEYAGHVRDVLLNLRERIVVACVVDVPTGTPLYREERIALGFTREDTAADVAIELPVAAHLFTRTFAALPPAASERRLVYSSQTPFEVTVGWLGAQAVHECEHHLTDVHENRTRLGGAAGAPG